MRAQRRGGEFLFLAELERLHRWRSATPGENLRAAYPEDYARMSERWRAFAHMAQYLLRHNRP